MPSFLLISGSAAFDDYLKNGDEKEIDKLLSFLKEQEKGNKSLHTEEAAKTGTHAILFIDIRQHGVKKPVFFCHLLYLLHIPCGKRWRKRYRRRFRLFG